MPPCTASTGGMGGVRADTAHVMLVNSRDWTDEATCCLPYISLSASPANCRYVQASVLLSKRFAGCAHPTPPPSTMCLQVTSFTLSVTCWPSTHSSSPSRCCLRRPACMMSLRLCPPHSRCWPQQVTYMQGRSHHTILTAVPADGGHESKAACCTKCELLSCCASYLHTAMSRRKYHTSPA